MKTAEPEYSIIKLLKKATFNDDKEPGKFVSDEYPFQIKLVAKNKDSKHPGRYTKVVILEPTEERKKKNRTHIATFDIPFKFMEAKTVLRVVTGIDIK